MCLPRTCSGPAGGVGASYHKCDHVTMRHSLMYSTRNASAWRYSTVVGGRSTLTPAGPPPPPRLSHPFPHIRLLAIAFCNTSQSTLYLHTLHAQRSHADAPIHKQPPQAQAWPITSPELQRTPRPQLRLTADQTLPSRPSAKQSLAFNARTAFQPVIPTRVGHYPTRTRPWPPASRRQ